MTQADLQFSIEHGVTLANCSNIVPEGDIRVLSNGMWNAPCPFPVVIVFDLRDLSRNETSSSWASVPYYVQPFQTSEMFTDLIFEVPFDLIQSGPSSNLYWLTRSSSASAVSTAFSLALEYILPSASCVSCLQLYSIDTISVRYSLLFLDGL